MRPRSLHRLIGICSGVCYTDGVGPSSPTTVPQHVANVEPSVANNSGQARATHLLSLFIKGVEATIHPTAFPVVGTDLRRRMQWKWLTGGMVEPGDGMLLQIAECARKNG